MGEGEWSVGGVGAGAEASGGQGEKMEGRERRGAADDEAEKKARGGGDSLGAEERGDTESE